MALTHRKFAVEPEKKPKPDNENPSRCYMCYSVCPKDCYISPPPTPPTPQPAASASQKHHISTILILMLCILSVAFLFLSYLTVRRYRFRNSRRRNLQALENGNLREDFLDENQGPVLDHPIWYIRTVGLPQSVIDSISVFQYKKGDGLIDGYDCSVCLSEFEENESLRLLPKCSHAFHLPCIDTWLRSHKNCPVCRAPVLIPNVRNNNNNNNNNNNIQVRSLETSSTDSVEENQARTELETRPDDARESRGGGENRCINGEKFRALSDLADHRVKLDQELEQRVRRSFSMDFSAAVMISDEVGKLDQGCSETKYEIVEKEKNSDMGCKKSSICRLIKSSSHGPVSMKRSFSFNGKRSLRKNSTSLESIPIPELSTQK